MGVGWVGGWIEMEMVMEMEIKPALARYTRIEMHSYTE